MKCILCKKLNFLNQFYVKNNHEQTVERLLNYLDYHAIPVDISTLLKRLDIPCYYSTFTSSEKYLETESFESPKINGMIHIENDNLMIYYNQKHHHEDDSNHKIRFTLAHELAHAIFTLKNYIEIK